MSDATAQAQEPNTATPISGRSRKLLWFGVFIGAVLIAVIFAVAFHNMRVAQSSMEADVLERQKTLIGARAETMDSWLASQVEQSRRLVGSDLFQLFASEVDKLADGVPLLFTEDAPGGDAGDSESESHQLSSQLPLMRTMLSEFVSYSGFSAARIVTSRAESYMNTEASVPPLTTAQKAFIAKVVEGGELVYAPVEVQSKGLNLDIYLPIMAYQRQDGRPVAVLIVSMTIDTKLSEFLSPGISDQTGRKLKLVQRNGDIFQHVAPSATLLRQVSGFSANDDGSVAFALRKAVGENIDVYSSGIRLRSADFWLVAENDASVIEASLGSTARTTYGLAGVLSVALVLLFSAGWWRFVGQEQCTLNAHITDLLSVISEQKKLLDGINSTISDPISLTDGKGVYRYVNNAFGEAVGRKPEEVVGLDGPAIFGFDTAKRLNTSDQHVLMTGESLSVTEVLWLQSKRFHFQISKTPLRESGSRTPQGIVSVFRDITKLVETEEHSRRVVQQTIDALVRTIEEADPFLGGHSRIMGSIAMLLAKQLRLSTRDTATIQAAANLSQIGKMFVPREILLKPGALTEEEKIEMERHVEHSRNVLKDIEFDLPVVDVISQMNERLDGKGYPAGLAGEDISECARILAVANAFTAMARPRSYRPALPVDEVMSILAKQSGSYDQDVVEALKEVIATPAGEKVVELAASSKAV